MQLDEKNLNCPCKRVKCERHGNCIACKEHHQTKNNYKVACERIKEKEERKIQREERKVRKK